MFDTTVPDTVNVEFCPKVAPAVACGRDGNLEKAFVIFVVGEEFEETLLGPA